MKYFLNIEFWKDWWEIKGKENFYYKPYRFFRDFYYFFRYDIYYGIKNIISYFPIIWNDRNWDYNYLLILIKFKLEKMKDVIEKNARHVGYEKNVYDMNLCIKYLDRITKDEYFNMFRDEYDKKWGESIDYFKPVEENMCEWIHTYSNIKTNEDEELSHEEYNQIMEKQRNQEIFDWNELFSIMKKNMKGWWD